MKEGSVGRMVRIVCLLTGQRDGLRVSSQEEIPAAEQTL